MRLDTPLDKVVGDRSAAILAEKLDLNTLGDLIHHYPRKYFTQGALTPLNELVLDEHVTVLARVRSSEVSKARTGKLMGKVVVTDGTGTLDLTFFGRPAIWQCERLKPGGEHLFAGTVSEFRGRRQLTHPQVFMEATDEALAKAGTVLPIYPAAKEIDTLAIGKAVSVALSMADLDDDPLPPTLRERHGLMGLRAALEAVHRPTHEKDAEPARERLRWDESFVLQVVLARRRAETAREGGTPRRGASSGLLDAFDARLPFALTAGQREVGDLLAEELASEHPMHRLLQGEVGSGKTVVALRAMLRVIDSGGQAALLAPTEVLAQQHARSLRALLGDLATAGELGSPDVATRVTVVTGSLAAGSKRRALEEVADGAAGIVVGTHALLYEGVAFRDLGLVVIDEQHRFGVEQRDALRAKGTFPHVLVMTATPIPRTVAMTVFGDLEVSTLRELPAGRSPITSRVVGEQSPLFAQLWERVRNEVSQGRQAFVVCPRIGDEETPKGEGRPPLAVLDVVERLAQGPLNGLRVEALHGRMPSEEKDERMRRFAAGDLDVLVSTTVIEVGVDVPNATVMVVLDAERFGISQLHQLRGRVGRGSHPATCALVTALPRDALPTQRLFAVASTQDGFELSRLDLEVRREGDVLGKDQSGARSSLRFLKLDDLDVIQESREVATALVEEDPDLAAHPGLRAAVDAILTEQRQQFIEKA